MQRLALLPLLAPLLALAACANPPSKVAEGPSSQQPSLEREAARIMPQRVFAHVDYLLVDKSERLMIGYAGGQPVRVWRGLQFGDQPVGHKQFEGDERTPEGRYVIEGRNPGSAYHLSLKISYPAPADRAFAEAQGRSPGVIFSCTANPTRCPSGGFRATGPMAASPYPTRKSRNCGGLCPMAR